MRKYYLVLVLQDRCMRLKYGGKDSEKRETLKRKWFMFSRILSCVMSNTYFIQYASRVGMKW